MHTKAEMDKLNQVTGEFTRIMILYWDMLGKPPLNEFLSLLPIEPVLEYINNSGQWDSAPQSNDYLM